MKFYPIDLDTENGFMFEYGKNPVNPFYVLKQIADDEALHSIYNHNYFHIIVLF